MGMVVERGFTVIELMLFLAISGLLLAGLMIGVGNNITQQRYSDNVASFKALLQDQYAEVLTPQNTSEKVKCNNTGPDADRGTTSCVILGKAVRIEKQGDNSIATISNVIGVEPIKPINPDYNKGDTDALKDFSPYISDKDQQTEDLNATIRNVMNVDRGNPVTIILYILRSPVSGLTKVLTDDMSIPTGPLLFCVDGDSGSMPKQVISVDPTIAGSGSVTSRDADTGECV